MRATRANGHEGQAAVAGYAKRPGFPGIRVSGARATWGYSGERC
jgi:hypothetical protein